MVLDGPWSRGPEMSKLFYLASFEVSIAEGKIKKGDPIITEVIVGILSQIVILLGIDIPDLDLLS